jgi:hypothetical protein
MSDSIQAKAFTHGSDIYFNSGQFQPNTEGGQRLLAHELVHTVQQGGRGNNKLQRDLATELPNPNAEQPILEASQMTAALQYNLDRFFNAAELAHIRDVLGVAPASQESLFDEEFINAIAYWQAQNNLTIDGKLGRETLAPLVAELRAEGSTSEADRLNIRTRHNELASNVDVNGNSDLFDAILSHRDAVLYLHMKINFSFTSTSITTDAQKQSWINRFIYRVQSSWGEMYRMIPVGRTPSNYLDTYTTNILITSTASNAHYQVNVFDTIPSGGVSNVDSTNRVGQFTTSDNDLYVGGSVQTDGSGNPRQMRQYTTSHEFGHMLGLPHIHCDTNSPDCYGTTQSERSNIMGLGNNVTTQNFTPFVIAMKALTGSDWRAI